MRPLPIAALVLALAPAVPATAHDLWLVPWSFAPATGEAIGVELWLGEAGEAVPVARHEAMFERFAVVGPPAGGEPAGEASMLPVLGLPGRRPAGVLRLPSSGAWTVVYLGTPDELTLTAERFAAHLEERGLREAERRWRARGAPAPVRERFRRSLKSLLAVDGGPPVDRLLGMPFELVLEGDGDGVCRIAVAAAGEPAPGPRRRRSRGERRRRRRGTRRPPLPRPRPVARHRGHPRRGRGAPRRLGVDLGVAHLRAAGRGGAPMSAVFAWSAETIRVATALAPVAPARIYSLPRMSGTVDDGELLRRIAKGDRDAFRLLWERYAGRVHSLLRLLAGDPAVVEDLLQETFLAVWRRAESYRPDRGDVSGWLFAIARNAVFDHRRRQGVRERYDPLVAGPTTTGNGGNGRDLRILVDKALGVLTPEQRHAVHMTYFAGYTYEETAERLDVPLGTLKSRIRAALKRLRGELGEETSP